jgi:hypothetical protein
MLEPLKSLRRASEIQLPARDSSRVDQELLVPSALTACNRCRSDPANARRQTVGVPLTRNSPIAARAHAMSSTPMFERAVSTSMS